ncbi:MAG: SEC-C domain-containing protein [Proteobacteria bacterium]|nr:SEC-C domain-containing protein [Pseudomonadota bacterium]
MKKGRNELCPCGSGLKYKKCCYELTVVPFDPEDPLNLLFVPWYLFNWTVDEPEEGILASAPRHKTVAESFRDLHKDQLRSDELAILDASNRRAFSFCQILEVEAGHSLKLLDLLRNETYEVIENTASRTLKPKEIIICANMLPIDGKLRHLALGPFAIPSENLEDILELRLEILERHKIEQIDEKILNLEDPFIIGLYLDLLDEILEEDEASETDDDDDDEGQDRH